MRVSSFGQGTNNRNPWKSKGNEHSITLEQTITSINRETKSVSLIKC